MVVKAARAPALKPAKSKLESAARTAATPAVALGRTVARMPPGPVVPSDGRAAGFGRGRTLSLPLGAGGASPTRGEAGGGGAGGVKGSRAGGRSLPVRLPSTERSRRIRKTAT